MWQGRTKHGFTLIELLVVISIIAVLAGILFPVVSTARIKAKETACLSHLQELTTALREYAADHHGYPPAPWYDAAGTARYHGGFSSLYPDYIEDKNIFICPEDYAARDHMDLAKEKVYCSYNGVVTTFTGVGAWQFDLDAGSRPLRLYNYFGYSWDTGDGTSQGYDLFNQLDFISPTHANPLPAWLAAQGLSWRGYPRLMSRRAPENSIITHCIQHRQHSKDVQRQMDIVARLSGRAEKVPVTSLTQPDSLGVAPFVHQR